MRFLGIGDTCDLGALYLRLSAEGHQVKVYVGEPLAKGTLAGMVAKSEDWRLDIDWIREAGHDGIVIFENVAHSRGSIQDELRASGLNVIGGSAFGDRLENDRAYAQKVLQSLGLNVANTSEFTTVADGLNFISANPKRYVLKFNGTGLRSSDNYVGHANDGTDVAAVLRSKANVLREGGGGFVLMQHVTGVEMGVGAYFDGNRFVRPACLDWEHKRFFTDDLGELTGEMGTVVTYDHTERFFSHTLLCIEDLLREKGYCGYINLNTIVNDEGVWPLEFTCRFGYPGFALLTPLQETSWSTLLSTLVEGRGHLNAKNGFCVGVVLTTPPFPYDRKTVAESVGLPVFLDPQLSPIERANLHYGEVGLSDGVLVTSGCYGWTMVVTGTGPTIEIAQRAALNLTDKIRVPNGRYRRDIGNKLIGGEWAKLKRWGWVN